MKTMDEIYGEMAATFRGETGLEVAGAGDLAVRFYAVAAQIYALYVQAEWTGRQCFPQTAVGEYLEQHASLRGLSRRLAARAKGTLRFSVGTAAQVALEIPKGTVCMTAGLVRFETTAPGKILPGATWADVAAQAVEPGGAGNAAPEKIRAMAVAPVGVSACTNPAAFAGGTDLEEDEALRQRVLETFRRLPNGANAAFYAQGAMSFPGVVAATVLPKSRGVGTVDVVVATATGLPDSALLAELTAYFGARREIAVDVAVKAPVPKAVAVTVAVKSQPGTAFSTVSAGVQQALRGYFNGTLLGQEVLRAKLGELIFAVPGVANYTMLAPAADVAVAKGELPQLGSLTVTELGA